MVACLSDNIQTIELLLDQHFTKNPSQLPPVDAAGNTVLHIGIIGNHDHVMVKMLEKMKSQYTTEQMKQPVNILRQSYMHVCVAIT